jgi:hypothetical protein
MALMRRVAPLSMVLASLLCAACATTGGAVDEGEPVVFGEEPPAEVVPEPSLAGKARFRSWSPRRSIPWWFLRSTILAR